MFGTFDLAWRHFESTAHDLYEEVEDYVASGRLD